MSPSLILKAGALALACASTVSATEKYTLDAGDNYKGSNFFDSFDFMSVSTRHCPGPTRLSNYSKRALILQPDMYNIKASK